MPKSVRLVTESSKVSSASDILKIGLQNGSWTILTYSLVLLFTRKYPTIYSPQAGSLDNTTKKFYFNRLPRLWSYLPVINTELSLSAIKYKLLNYLWSHFITNFNPDNKCSFSFLCPCINCSKHPKTPNFETLNVILCSILSVNLYTYFSTLHSCMHNFGHWYRKPVDHQCFAL